MALVAARQNVKARQSYAREVEQFKPSGWTQVHRGTCEDDADEKIQQAIPVRKVLALRYDVGQKMRITIDREEDRLRNAKAVVVLDCDRVVVVDAVNGFGRHELLQIQKADILRGSTGMGRQERKGALIVELY